MTTVIIVQARMTSTRLPGKVLKQVLGKPLLEYQIERLQRVKLADEIVIATTTNETDEPIVELCKRLAVAYFRGSEEDVLGRYYQAAREHKVDIVVRVTSDCPLIDPKVIDEVIDCYLKNQSNYDYVSNCLERTYPRGMDTEVFSFSTLQQAFWEVTAQPDREHVTSFIHRQPSRYRLGHFIYSEDCSHHRWTVDTPEDFELIQKIIEAIYPRKPNFTLEDCLSLLKKHPEWYIINSHVSQKNMMNKSTKPEDVNFVTEQEKFWSQGFGDEYTHRNQGDSLIARNLALFSKIFSHTQKINSLIEFGANRGLNIEAIKKLLPELEVSAVEINNLAVEELRKIEGMELEIYPQSILDFNTIRVWDFVLIKGVLIHINPNCLEQVYDRLYESSERYICIVEYYNPTPVEITYRGHQGKLFKRDFAGEMLDRFKNLQLLDYGFVYHRDSHFPQDDLTWFLLEK